MDNRSQLWHDRAFRSGFTAFRPLIVIMSARPHDFKVRFLVAQIEEPAGNMSIWSRRGARKLKYTLEINCMVLSGRLVVQAAADARNSVLRDGAQLGATHATGDQALELGPLSCF
jgi:hypothetical protein